MLASGEFAMLRAIVNPFRDCCQVKAINVHGESKMCWHSLCRLSTFVGAHPRPWWDTMGETRPTPVASSPKEPYMVRGRAALKCVLVC